MPVYLAADDEPAIVLGVVLGDLLEGVDLGHIRRRGSPALRGVNGWGSRSTGEGEIPNSPSEIDARDRDLGLGKSRWARGRGDCSAFKTTAVPSPPPPQILLRHCYGLRPPAPGRSPTTPTGPTPPHPSRGQHKLYGRTHMSAAGGGRAVGFILPPRVMLVSQFFFFLHGLCCFVLDWNPPLLYDLKQC